VEESRHGGAGAVDGHVAARFPGPAHAADEGAESGGVEEGHAGEIDEERGDAAQLAERLPELPHGEGVQLTHGAADRVAVALVDVDLEQRAPSKGFGVG
jgi:hypothetical protein